MHKIAVLRNDLIILVAEDDIASRDLERLHQQAQEVERALGVQILIFGGASLVDMRQAAPEEVEACRVVDEMFTRLASERPLRVVQ